MPDGDGGTFSQVGATIGEAIVAPVKQQAELAMNETISAISGQYQASVDPQEAAKKAEEEARKKQQDAQKVANIRLSLNLAAQEQQRFMTLKQKESQEKMIDIRKNEEDKQKKKFTLFKKEQDKAVLNESSRKGKNEIKGGIGG